MYSTDLGGQTLLFGTSGFLYRSNKLMYDRNTHTLWHQFLGEPVVGPLADSGITLEVLPVTLTTWDEWAGAHPDTTVLDIETGVYPSRLYLPEWHLSSIYFDYRLSPETMFPAWQRQDILPAKEEVLGLKVNGEAKAYPLDLLVKEPVVNDSLGGTGLAIVTVSHWRASRAYERDANRFSLADEETSTALVDDKGRRWRVEEDALVREDDPAQRLRRLPSHVAYWFGWYAFYPATQLFGEPT